MRHRTSSSFRDSLPDDLPHTEPTHELKPPHCDTNHPKVGSETWSCAWSGDHFAWSCGNRIVQLVPWNSKYVPQSLAAASPPPSPDPTKDDSHDTLRHGPVFVFDCGTLVWSLAFGSGTSNPKPRAWRRFTFTGDTILATGLQNGHIKLWDCRTGCLLMELLDHQDVIRDLHFAPDNSLRLASASRDGSVKLWDLNDDGNMYQTLRTEAQWVYSCAWSPDATILACVGNYKSVVLWDMTTGTKKILRKLIGHHHDVVSCRFSNDGALLATASYDSRVILWDPHNGDIISELHHMYPPPSPIFAGGHNDHFVRSVSFAPHCSWLVTVCDDGFLRFWDALSPDEPKVIADISNCLCCSYSPSGSILAVGSRNGKVTLYEAPTSVHSLQHWCRMSIRKHIPSTKIDFLHLPFRVKEYLKYKLQ